MLKSTYVAPPLPPGWTEHRAPSGHLYYYNSQTKKSTYTRPQASPVPEPVPQTFPVQPDLTYSPQTLPPFSSTPYGPARYESVHAFSGRARGGFRGGRGYQDRKRREPEDRPKSKYAIPDCAPWVLVKTRLGRRFVYNPETNESFWKFPQNVLKGVVEFDRMEREKKERKERGEEKSEDREAPELENKGEPSRQPQAEPAVASKALEAGEESDEYEEVEVTEDEEEELQASKRPRTEGEGNQQQHVEFTEEDIEYQLAAMGEEYGLDPEEYGDPVEEAWEEGAEGLPLTKEDTTALFRDLLDDYHINPYSPWERIIEEGRIIEDTRYTALPNMKARREAFSNWSRDRIQELKERKEKQEKKDPRIKYLAFLQEHATPKLYWTEFKRKFRKEPEMKDTKLSDKDREKFYRDLISRLKLPESSRKSDLSALLKSVSLQSLNRSSNVEALPPAIVTDLRYISLPPKVRDPLIETYISTLPPAPEQEHISSEQQAEIDRKMVEREKRERAFAERERRVQEEKQRQKGDLLRGKHLLKEGEAEIKEAMKVRKDGLRGYMETDDQPHKDDTEKE